MILADTGYDKWHWCWPDWVTRRGQEHAKSNIPLDRVSKGWREDFSEDTGHNLFESLAAS